MIEMQVIGVGGIGAGLPGANGGAFTENPGFPEDVHRAAPRRSTRAFKPDILQVLMVFSCLATVMGQSMATAKSNSSERSDERSWTAADYRPDDAASDRELIKINLFVLAVLGTFLVVSWSLSQPPSWMVELTVGGQNAKGDRLEMAYVR